jgi:hypothetical protein
MAFQLDDTRYRSKGLTKDYKILLMGKLSTNMGKIDRCLPIEQMTFALPYQDHILIKLIANDWITTAVKCVQRVYEHFLPHL